MISRIVARTVRAVVESWKRFLWHNELDQPPCQRVDIDLRARSRSLWVTVAAGSINPWVVRSLLLLQVSALHTERR